MGALLQLGIRIGSGLVVNRSRDEGFLIKLLAGLILDDILHDLLSHLVRVLDGVGENLAVLDRLLAVELTVEADDLDLILPLGLLDGGVGA